MSGGQPSRGSKGQPPARSAGSTPANRSPGPQLAARSRASTPSPMSAAISRNPRQSRSPVPPNSHSKVVQSPLPNPQPPMRKSGQSPAKSSGLKPPVSAVTPVNPSPAPQSRGGPNPQPPMRKSGQSPAKSAGLKPPVSAVTPVNRSPAPQSRGPNPQPPMRKSGQSPAKSSGLKPPVSAVTPVNPSPAPQSRGGPTIPPARKGGKSPARSAGSTPANRSPGPQLATRSRASTPSPMSTAISKNPGRSRSPVPPRTNSKSPKPKGHVRHSGESLAPAAPLPPHVTAAIAAAIRTHTPERASRSIPDTPVSESVTQDSITQRPSRSPPPPSRSPPPPSVMPQNLRRSRHSKHVARSQHGGSPARPATPRRAINSRSPSTARSGGSPMRVSFPGLENEASRGRTPLRRVSQSPIRNKEPSQDENSQQRPRRYRRRSCSYLKGVHVDDLPLKTSRQGLTFEGVLYGLNPWHPKLLRMVIIMSLVSFVCGFGKVYHEMIFTDPEDLTYYHCNGSVMDSGSDVGAQLKSLQSTNYLSQKQNYHVRLDHVKIGITTVTTVSEVLIFSFKPPRILSPYRVLVIFLIIASLSSMMFTTKIFGHVTGGVIIYDLVTKVATCISITLLVGTLPRHLREFAMVMGSFCSAIGAFVFIATWPLLKGHLPYVGCVLWAVGALVVTCYGHTSIHDMIANHRIPQLRSLLTRMGYVANVDQIVDDVLFAGRDEEPRHPYTITSRIFDAEWPRIHLMYYTAVLWFTSMEFNTKSVFAPHQFTTLQLPVLWIYFFSAVGMAGMMWICLWLGRKTTMEICLGLMTIVYTLNAILPITFYDKCQEHYMHWFGTTEQASLLDITFPIAIEYLSLTLWGGAFTMANIIARLSIAEMVPQHARLFVIALTNASVDWLMLASELILQTLYKKALLHSIFIWRITPFVVLFWMTDKITFYTRVVLGWQCFKRRFKLDTDYVSIEDLEEVFTEEKYKIKFEKWL